MTFIQKVEKFLKFGENSKTNLDNERISAKKLLTENITEKQVEEPKFKTEKSSCLLRDTRATQYYKGITHWQKVKVVEYLIDHIPAETFTDVKNLIDTKGPDWWIDQNYGHGTEIKNLLIDGGFCYDISEQNNIWVECVEAAIKKKFHLESQRICELSTKNKSKCPTYQNCSFPECPNMVYLPHYCEYCEQYFCDEHRLPFNHDCKHYNDYKKKTSSGGTAIESKNGKLFARK